MLAARAGLREPAAVSDVANQVTHTVYGNLPNNAANQDAGVGAYSDLITATITY